MSLLTIAELLAGEALVTPGGPVDRMTAAGDEPLLWSAQVVTVEITLTASERSAELARVPAGV